MSSGWDQDQRPRNYVAERRANAYCTAIFVVGGLISLLGGINRAEPVAIGIGVFLLIMAIVQWKLR